MHYTMIMFNTLYIPVYLNSISKFLGTAKCSAQIYNNKAKNFSVFESVCPCANSRLNGNSYWYLIWYGVSAPRRVFFENRSRFLKIQILSYFFWIFSIIIFLMGWIFSSKYCTFSVLAASNRTDNSLLNTSYYIMTFKCIDF